MSDNSPTTKKRKANDGRATVPDDGGGGGLFSSWLGYFSGRREDNAQPTTCGGGENLTHKIDTMMQMMSRMEEKCSRLETECSSLKNALEIKTNSLKEHVDTKIGSLVRHHEYNSMLVRNQSWEYSTPVHPAEYWEDIGYNENVAFYLAECSNCLKGLTEKLRRGEFPDNHGNNEKGIELDWPAGPGGIPILDEDAMINMSPHWEEFANAIKQFAPAFGVLPDGCETYFTLQYVQLGGSVPELLKDALMNKPFQQLSFANREDADDNQGMSADVVMDIMNNNKHLRKLRIGNNRIQLGHIEKICSAVHHGSIVELNLLNCFENGLGDEMVTSLLTSGGLVKLERLGLDSNGITSNGITLLANFLATNPPLQELDLSNNGLSGDCVDLLANALQSNTSLTSLDLCGNGFGENVGREAFHLAMHNDSSLNSIADSNHSCVLEGVGFSWNVDGIWKNGAWHEVPASFNRAGKIYSLLSERNESTSTSNVQHFGDIDVKLLPSILEAVQRYRSVVHLEDFFSPTGDIVEALSIVYEVMRKWDKVFPLYTD